MKKMFCDACGKEIEHGYKPHTAVSFAVCVRENNYSDTVSEVGDCCVPCYTKLVLDIKKTFSQWKKGKA